MSTATENRSAPASQSTELATLANEYHLLPAIVNKVIDTLAPFAADAGAIAREAQGVMVESAADTDAIAKSKDLRKRIAKVRLGADKARAELKAEYLKPGQYIDKAARHIAGLIEPVETRLREQEEFAERQELKRRADLKAHRETLLRPYTTDTSAYQLDTMSADAFADLLNGQKLAHEARQAAAKKAEDDRLAEEKARKEEADRLAAENKRLRDEADKREAAAKLERDAAAAKLWEQEDKARKEREDADAKAKAERDRLEADAKAARDAAAKLEREAAERKAAEEAQAKLDAARNRKAARAPDRDKLMTIADSIEALAHDMPVMKTEDGKAAARRIAGILDTCRGAIADIAKEL